ncbi:MAG: hypothetical protein RMK20_02865 [Verrucomicrobiales bacterium]|nr:hypothetical protein [Verrucomicrobiales bacterium]
MKPNLTTQLATPLALPGIIAIALAVSAAGCGNSSTESPSTAPVLKPAEAANQLQQVFVSAPPEVRQNATAMSEALRTADYDAAIRSLQAIKARPDLTPQQQMAIHESSAALEARLIEGMSRGDPKAKAAYERLRKSRRN